MKRFAIPIIFLIYLVAVFFVPFLSGYVKTPPGKIYLGTVHFPIDYFFYLSHLTQGKQNLIFTDYLYTTESLPKLFLGWIYVPFGRIASVIHLPPIIMYEVMLWIFGFSYLFFSYKLLCRIFPASQKKRILAFLLFLFSNTFPRIVEENGVKFIAQYYSWYNYGEPLVRFPSIPHQLLLQSSIFMMIYVFFAYSEAHKKSHALLMLLCSAAAGLVLGSTQPIQWILISVCLFPLVIFQAVKRRSVHIPYLLFVGVGLFFAWYVKGLFAREPFQFMNLWETQQSPFMPLEQFIHYHGPVLLIGLLGLPWFMKTKNLSRYVITAMTILAVTLFFLPISKKLPFLTFRYLSALPIFFYASSAAEGIFSLSKLTRKFQPLVLAMTLTLLCFLLGPLFIRELGEKMNPDKNDTSYYLSHEAADVFEKAREISTLTDTFLVFWPYETIFPALTGRREFIANKFFTIDFEKKNQNAYRYLVNQMPETERLDFLKKNAT